MQNAKELLPLINYQIQWLLIGCGLFLLVLLWIGFVFWATRHKKPRTVSTLKAKPAPVVDISGLKRKYLKLIDDVQRATTANEFSARQAHQKLSLLVRLFAFEASGFRAQIMTLSDLEHGRFPKLKEVIATYYPNEFGLLLTGTVDDALSRAREMVSSWQ